jgi:hypothetical protein
MVGHMLEQGWSVVATAAAFGASPRTAHRWLARLRRDGRSAWSSAARRPHQVANRLARARLAMVTRLCRDTV